MDSLITNQPVVIDNVWTLVLIPYGRQSVTGLVLWLFYRALELSKLVLPVTKFQNADFLICKLLAVTAMSCCGSRHEKIVLFIVQYWRSEACPCDGWCFGRQRLLWPKG